jgi:hypothetical protein
LEEIRADLEKRVLKLAIPTIEKHVFNVICPDYSHKPHAVVENIKQWTKDADGNVKVQTIKEYYFRFMLAVQPFVKNKTLPVDVASIVIQNMHDSYKPSFKETYPNHSQPHDRDGRLQRAALGNIYRQATLAGHPGRRKAQNNQRIG